MSEPVDTSAVRAYTNIETAFHDGLWIRESDYDRLQSALAAAQQRLSELEALLAERNRQNARAFEQADAYKRDAERYRWLRDEDNGWIVEPRDPPTDGPDTFNIDAAIDAAMGAKEGMCQHDLLLPDTTCIVGSDPFSATCTVCKTTYTTKVLS